MFRSSRTSLQTALGAALLIFVAACLHWRLTNVKKIQPISGLPSPSNVLSSGPSAVGTHSQKRQMPVSAVPKSSAYPGAHVLIPLTVKSSYGKPARNYSHASATEPQPPHGNLAHSPLSEIQAHLAHSAAQAATAPFNWNTVGPTNPLGVLAGRAGKLQAFAWEPSNPSVMYAGGGNGSGSEGPFTETGVFKTTDGGSSWISINNGLTDTSVNVLWIDYSNPQNLLAGGEFGGIFHTTDGGQSWSQVSTDAPVSAIVSFNGGVLAGTGVGIEFSSDGGVSWTLLQGTTAPVRCLAVNGGDAIAGVDNGEVMWRTPTSKVWQTVATNPQPSNPQNAIFDVAIDPVDPATAYYGRGCCGSSIDLVYHTANRGATWNLISPPDNGFSQALAVRPSDRAVLVAGQGYFLASTDFGATWRPLSAPWDSRRIFILPNGSLVMGSDHGLHWTDNMGTSWLDITKTLSTNILYAAAVNGNTILTSSQDFGPFVSKDGGQTWQGASGAVAEVGAVAINPGNPNYCYAYTTSGLAVSKDGCLSFQSVAGPSWQYYSPPDSPPANQNSFTVSPTGPSTVFLAAMDGVWSSTDWGMTWSRLAWPFQKVTNVVLDPVDPLTIYVCAAAGFYQSVDGGATWTKLKLPTSSTPFVAAISPADNNVILVAMADGAARGGGVVRSSDRGVSFQIVNQGLPTVYSCCGDQAAIAFNPDSPAGAAPVVALATSVGVYASGDLGTTWTNVSANAVPTIFSFLQWSQGYLFASTYGQGVLRSDQPVTSALFPLPLAVSGGPISLTYVQGLSSALGSQTLQTTGVAGSFTVAVNQGSGACGNWLSANPMTGATTAANPAIPITISYNLGGIPANTNIICDGTVTVTSAGGTVSTPVAIQIMPLSQTRLQNWSLDFTVTPSGLMSMSMAYDSRRHVTVMFGGRDNTLVYSNTYQYTPTGWKQVSTPNSPPPRYWSAMAYDDHRQRVVLFGGQDNTTNFGDTWEFDGANWTQTSTAHSPGAQSATSMIYDSCRQKSVLFDGQGKTWEYDGADWAKVVTAAAPSVRGLSAMVFDAGHCRALLFGGIPPSLNGLADTWSYDGTGWKQINTLFAPAGRWGHVMAFDTNRGRTVLFGGYGPVYPSGTNTNDTWEFDGATWVQVAPQTSPPSLVQAAMVYDQSRSRVVMFGQTQAWDYTPGPMWAVTATPAGTFSQGQTGGTYTVTVSNVWTAPTSGTVTLTETIPQGLSLVSLSGTGWTCAPGASTCTRTDPLSVGASYPPITVTVNVAANAPPWATNFVTASGGGLTTATAADLTPIAVAGPQISLAGIINAASSQSGGIAPNEFISLMGTGLGPATGGGSAMTLQIAGTSVSIGGTPAYLTYASNRQINALVPFGVSGSSTTIQVRYNGVAGNTVAVPVVASSPGIFTQQYGPGQVWMVNQDGTFNSSSNPAVRNSYVTFWVTGQGTVNIPLTDGAQPTGPPFPTPLLPVTVSLGGVAVPAANVAFDGLVYSGEMQINLLIPAGAPSGNAVPLVVTVGPASSRSDATIAIR